MEMKFYAWIFNVLSTVWKMRSHQKAFFKNRERADLVESKRLEAEVDKMLKQCLEFENGEPVALMNPQDTPPAQEQERLF